MKALDTGVLLALLEGSTKARDLVRKLRGSELATTEANLLELTLLAGGPPAKSRGARLAALEKLRQRLTVLPIDARAIHAASSGWRPEGKGSAWSTVAMLGALEAAGCEELLTDDGRYVSGNWHFRTKVVHL